MKKPFIFLIVLASFCFGAAIEAVNVNTNLLPRPSVDLGGTTKPFRDLYLYGTGTYGTNYLRLTGLPTGARTFTIPDRTGTLATTSGTLTSGNCAKFDASGNIVDNGAVCGGGGGSTSDFTAPTALATWTWVNQGAATGTDQTAIFAGSKKVSGITIQAPADAGPNLRILKKTAPSTPYTITIAFEWNFRGNNYYGVGFCWRQSSDGKLVTAAIEYGGGFFLNVNKWNSPTSFNSNYIGLTFQQGLTWLKCQDNGTNRIVSYSADGVTWIVVYTIGRTDFLTGNEVGFYVNTQNVGYGSVGSFVHWVQT